MAPRCGATLRMRRCPWQRQARQRSCRAMSVSAAMRPRGNLALLYARSDLSGTPERAARALRRCIDASAPVRRSTTCAVTLAPPSACPRAGRATPGRRPAVTDLAGRSPASPLLQGLATQSVVLVALLSLASVVLSRGLESTSTTPVSLVYQRKRALRSTCSTYFATLAYRDTMRHMHVTPRRVPTSITERSLPRVSLEKVIQVL